MVANNTKIADAKIGENLWIAGGYYVDFDQLGQFRIIGPNNHLYCGLVDVPPHKIKIKSVGEEKNVLHIKGYFKSSRLNFYYPAMDDMRTVRSATHQSKGWIASFLEIRGKIIGELVPQVIKVKNGKDSTSLVFRRLYEEDLYYETVFEFPRNVSIKKINKPYRGFELSSKSDKIEFSIKASTNDLNYKKFNDFFSTKKKQIDFKVFGKSAELIKSVWSRTEKEIEHLVSWNKTSGDRFGTVFPRDFMEAADLGVHDLSEDVRSYMYEVSMRHVSKKGEGWHEDVVGEYKYEYEISGKDIFDRHMIDIEPRYLMGMEYLPEDFFLNKDNREKLRLVANYVANMARENNFITFKKLPHESEKYKIRYYETGDWRDSGWAYKKVADVIAPFDVNAVFYPIALRILSKFQNKLSLDIRDINKLVKKWEDKKNDYLFKNPDGTSAYALALYNPGRKEGKNSWQKMKVNHLDESYLYVYGKFQPRDIESFCDRLLDKKYFYTESGPLIIAKNNNLGYTTAEYHGLVIWTKQTAFTVLGLSRSFKKAIIEEWDKELLKKMKKTILKMCENTFNAFTALEAIPELYWDDNGRARFFSDQPNAKVTMSKVQLWSAVGARRIIRKYYELLTDPRYKI